MRRTSKQVNLTQLKSSRDIWAQLCHASGLTARQRLNCQSNRDHFYVEGDLLFCKVCCITVELSRQSNLQQHLDTGKHKLAAEKQKTPAKRQKTIETTLPIQNESKFAKTKVILDYVHVLIATNQSLESVNNHFLREFFVSHVTNGGALPKSAALYSYIDDVYSVELNNLKNYFQNEKLIIIFDETSDDLGRFVANILFAKPPSNSGILEPKLVSTIFEKKSLDHQKVCQLVMRTVQSFNIEYENIVAFCSDNAAYMLKAHRDVLSSLFPNCVHLTCVPHILNLVCKDYLKPFEKAISWVKMWSCYTKPPNNRRGKWLDFLTRKNMTPKVAPVPIETRWTSLFDALVFHKEHFDVEAEFIELQSQDLNNIPATLSDLNEICENKNDWAQTKMEIFFLAERAKVFINCIKLFESNLGQILFLSDKLQSLSTDLRSQIEFDDFTVLDHISSDFMETISPQLCSVFVTKVALAAEKTSAKLMKYFNKEHGVYPSLQFLHDVQFFNPHRALEFLEEPQLIIPGFENVPATELHLYREKCRQFDNTTIEDLKLRILRVLDFWRANLETLPVLATLAMDYRFLFATSADAERSFSYLRKLVSKERKGFKEETIVKLLFLYFNLSV